MRCGVDDDRMVSGMTVSVPSGRGHSESGSGVELCRRWSGVDGSSPRSRHALTLMFPMSRVWMHSFECVCGGGLPRSIEPASVSIRSLCWPRWPVLSPDCAPIVVRSSVEVAHREPRCPLASSKLSVRGHLPWPSCSTHRLECGFCRGVVWRRSGPLPVPLSGGRTPVSFSHVDRGLL